MRRVRTSCALLAALALAACETLATETISGARYRAILSGGNQMDSTARVTAGTADLVVVNDTSLAFRITAMGLPGFTEAVVHDGPPPATARITLSLVSGDSARHAAGIAPVSTAPGAVEATGRVTPSMVVTAGGTSGRPAMDSLQRLMASGRAFLDVRTSKAGSELRGRIEPLP